MESFNTLKMFIWVKLFIKDCLFIRQDSFPLKRRNYRQLHCSFEIRLIKQNKNSISMIWLELSINILLLINIDKANTAITIIIILVFIDHSNMVLPFFEIINIQVQKSILMPDFFNWCTINSEFSDFLCFAV